LFLGETVLRKIYEIIPEETAARDDFLRIVEGSGEDYLYHKSYFIVVEFPIEAVQALGAAQVLTT
jgi:hypothetical protein